jgi:uncharacterized protein YkwD
MPHTQGVVAVPIVVTLPDSPGRTRSAAALLALGLAVLGAMSLPRPAHAAARPVLDPQEQAMCRQINAYRAAKGLRALKISPKLTRAAQWMSRSMATHDYFDHVDSYGRDTTARIRSFGYRFTGTGENLAAGMSTARATFRQWKNDPPHRAIMLKPQLRVIGIGRDYGAGSMFGWYWSATFGRTNDHGVAC